MMSNVLKALSFHRKFASAATATASVPTARTKRVVEEKVSSLPEGLTVASVDLERPVSQLVFAFRAGSRYEQPDEAGLVHFLRNIVGTDSSRYSGLKLLWQSGSIGSNVISSASKDLFLVQMSVIRSNDKIGLSILGEMAQPAFKPWEVKSREETLNQDLLSQTPEELVVENLHKAAYRNGTMATPILSPAHQLGKRTYRQLQAYARSRFVAQEAALVGINVDHSILIAYAKEQKPVPKGEVEHKQAFHSPYFGGDVRLSGDTPFAHVAIAGQGGKLSDIKSVAIQSVLCGVIGKGPNTKLVTTMSQGVVSKHVATASNHNPFGLSAINIIHSDNGLCGVYLVARGDQIAPLVRAAISGIQEISTSGPSDEDLSIAKYNVTVDTLVRAENSSALALDIAAQVLANAKTVSPNEFVQMVNNVTANEVKNAASQLLAKLSLSAYGQIHQVPYADVI